MDKKELELIIKELEGLTIEFKEKYTPRIVEDIVAFSNTRGGFIVLGVICFKTGDGKVKRGYPENTQKTPRKHPEKTQKIINAILEKPTITRKELAKKLGLSDDSIKHYILILKKKSVLKRIGPDKGGYWEVIK